MFKGTSSNKYVIFIWSVELRKGEQNVDINITVAEDRNENC